MKENYINKYFYPFKLDEYTLIYELFYNKITNYNNLKIKTFYKIM